MDNPHSSISGTDTNGIVERLADSLRTEAGFYYVNPNLTSERCPALVEPSLEGARFDEKIGSSRAAACAELRRIGRRPATVAEGLLYGLTHPDEVLVRSWIWCFGDIVTVDGNELTLLLLVEDGKLFAVLYHVSDEIDEDDRVLSFPMTEAELAQRDAEDTAAARAD